MNTKEFTKLASEELYEVLGGYNDRQDDFPIIIDKICTEIKEFLTS